MARKNLVPNPGYESSIAGTSVTAGTGGTAAVSRQTVGARTGAAFLRAAWSVASTAAGTVVTAGPNNRAPVVAGVRHYVSQWVRPSATRALRPVAVTATTNAGGTTTTTNGGYVTCPAGQWTELTLEVVPAAGRVFLETRVQSQTGVSGNIDVDDVAVVADPQVVAAVVDSGAPAPVQIVFRALAGEEYVVTGSALGSTWPVPGGVGVADGSQVVLVDNRSALNVPVVYTVTIGGVPYQAAPVTVALPGVKVALQSLNGRTSVILDDFHANGMPRETEVNAHVSRVPGRFRPPVRYATGGAGGGAYRVRTDRAGSEAMWTLLEAGRPIIVRTDGNVRDHPAVEIVLITAAPSSLFEAYDRETGQMSDGRVWDLSFLLVDDPEPSARLSLWSWDQIDELGLTWDQVDALGLTVDQAETYDWGQLV